MAKKKKLRFAQIATFPNVFQHLQKSEEAIDLPLKGKWNRDHFGNDHPLVLELGCGKGEYTVGLSGQYPGKNFVGVDLKGNRIFVGAKQCLDNSITNAAFLRARIENITHCFGKGEVSEIWITFPDPQPQSPRERKRLTFPRFLKYYRQILKPGGVVHLKTDARSLYDYTLETLEKEGFPVLIKSDDLYAQRPAGLEPALFGIQTHYEKLFTAKGHLIHYIQFSFPSDHA